ncbi:MAG TPA: hypothetical protein VK474_09365, partial [Chthoniobacterales bacterium]|nr:hypothetical protein [Chthoniobacterales bacterium]
LSEEDLLTQGGIGSVRSTYVSASGFMQRSELRGDVVTSLAEQTCNVTQLFEELPRLIAAGPFSVTRRSESGTGTDGPYPPYEQLFFRLGDRSGALYGGLIKDAPPAVANLVREMHQLCPNEARAAPSGILVQASHLDDATAQRFREQHLLRAVSESDFGAAALTRRALREPFRFLPCSAAELRADSIANGLTPREPAVDLEYAGAAFQLRLLNSTPGTPPP